jgi:hypothetical protein
MKSVKLSKKRTHPKIKLGLPDLDQAKAAVLGTLHSSESQRGYRHSINEFISWYCSEPRLSFNKTVVTRYRIYLESRPLVTLRCKRRKNIIESPFSRTYVEFSVSISFWSGEKPSKRT